MKNEDKQTSEGLNQIFEIINAKGDEAELKRIVTKGERENLTCSDELFNKDLRAIVDDTVRGKE